MSQNKLIDQVVELSISHQGEVRLAIFESSEINLKEFTNVYNHLFHYKCRYSEIYNFSIHFPSYINAKLKMIEKFGVPKRYSEINKMVIYFLIRLSLSDVTWQLVSMSDSKEGEFIINDDFLNTGNLTFAFKNEIKDDTLDYLCKDSFESTYVNDISLFEWLIKRSIVQSENAQSIPDNNLDLLF